MHPPCRIDPRCRKIQHFTSVCSTAWATSRPLTRKGRTGKFSWMSWQSINRLGHGGNNTSGINWQVKLKGQICDSHKLQIHGLGYNWWGFPAWDTLGQHNQKQHWQDKPLLKSISLSTEIRLIFSRHIHLICFCIMDLHRKTWKWCTIIRNKTTIRSIPR